MEYHIGNWFPKRNVISTRWRVHVYGHFSWRRSLAGGNQLRFKRVDQVIRVQHGTSRGFQQWRYPKMAGLQEKIPLQWMIWRYLHFLDATLKCCLKIAESFFCFPQWLTGWWFQVICWLVVWLPFFIFPYIGNNHPNWLIFFRGVQTTNQLVMLVMFNNPQWLFSEG